MTVAVLWSFNKLYRYLIQCVRKVAVHLQNVLEVMSKSVYTGLNTFNFGSYTVHYRIYKDGPTDALSCMVL
jgi:hypothetical protein